MIVLTSIGECYMQRLHRYIQRLKKLKKKRNLFAEHCDYIKQYASLYLVIFIRITRYRDIGERQVDTIAIVQTIDTWSRKLLYSKINDKTMSSAHHVMK